MSKIKIIDSENFPVVNCNYKLVEYKGSELIRGSTDKEGISIIPTKIVLNKMIIIYIWSGVQKEEQAFKSKPFEWHEGIQTQLIRKPISHKIRLQQTLNTTNETQDYRQAYYIVKDGDTWDSINKKCGDPIPVLQIINNNFDINPVKGTILVLPINANRPLPDDQSPVRNLGISQCRSYENGRPVAVIQTDITCFCRRDFTVEEIKSILQVLHGSKVVPLWNPAQKTGAAPDNHTLEATTHELNRIMKKYEINTCIRKLHFLAQVFHETHGFRSSQEYGTHLVYDPYRGRGFIHLTHDVLYRKFSNYMQDPRIILEPQIVAKKLEYAAESGGWYWIKGSAWGNLNKWADKDDLFYLNIGVNGGFNGFKERVNYVKTLIELLNIKQCNNLKLSKVIGIYTYDSSDIKHSKYGKKNETKFKIFDDR